ncbi:transcriptional regulator with XRE-family HTH domain [Lysobacter sp. OAE881]|uniref:helix-turn-helix domain-containing protein n=1 Tax=Lysobacter sp. OAE881 TaxID=2663813 RepID=UPI00178C13D1
MAQPIRACDLIDSLLAAGMSRTQIAQRTGLSPGYITMLRQGDRGKRIGWSAYSALHGLAVTREPQHQVAAPDASQTAAPARWSPTDE